MKESLWSSIREMFFIEKLSKKEIARRLKVSRNTVKKACKNNIMPDSTQIKTTKLDAYKEKINELLKEYPSLSAVRTLEEIKKLGYDGGISILKSYISKIRPAHHEAFVRIETDPGEQAQVDWGNFGTIKCGEHERKLSCFVMVLSYSRKMYIEWCLSARLEDFIRCHINAFRYFGLPLKMLYDNLKSVVLYRYEKHVHFNPKFLRFAGMFPFSVRLCGKRKGNEKGKVESGIKYIRINFFAGRKFTSYDDLIKQSNEWLSNTANVRIHGTTRERPEDRYLKEKDILRKVENIDYDSDIIAPVRSSKDCRIKFDSNVYSVPHYHNCKSLIVKASQTEVKIYNKNKLIAVHKRCYDKYKVIENPAHIKELLEIKRNARESKLHNEFTDLGILAEKYFSGLVHAVSNVGAHIEKILELKRRYGKTEILNAIEHAIGYQAYGANYIENIIITRRSLAGEPIINTPLTFPENPGLEEINITDPDLSKYDDISSTDATTTNEQTS